jgi:hypothetical protein
MAFHVETDGPFTIRVGWSDEPPRDADDVFPQDTLFLRADMELWTVTVASAWVAVNKYVVPLWPTPGFDNPAVRQLTADVKLKFATALAAAVKEGATSAVHQ